MDFWQDPKYNYGRNDLHYTKKGFPLKTSSVNVITADLVTFTEEILDGKLHFLCSVRRA